MYPNPKNHQVKLLRPLRIRGKSYMLCFRQRDILMVPQSFEIKVLRVFAWSSPYAAGY